MARRLTNVIRRDGSASWRTKAKPMPGEGDSAHREGLPAKRCARSVAWLTTGRLDGCVRGLGMPVGTSGGNTTPTGDRGVIVPLKPVKSGGGKGARKSDLEVYAW